MVQVMRAAAVWALLLAIPLTAGAAVQAPDDGFIGVQVKVGPDGKGLQVVDAFADSPAAKAGVKADDLILKVDGKDVGRLADFVEQIRGTKPGTRLVLIVKRDGQEMRLRVTVGKRPAGQ
jgi:S1-C subfamily serine protease